MLTTWPLLPKTSLENYSLMTEPKRKEIVSRWRAGSTIRRIARQLGLARNTVSRVLVGLGAQRSGTATPSLGRLRRLDTYEPAILKLLG